MIKNLVYLHFLRFHYTLKALQCIVLMTPIIALEINSISISIIHDLYWNKHHNALIRKQVIGHSDWSPGTEVTKVDHQSETPFKAGVTGRPSQVWALNPARGRKPYGRGGSLLPLPPHAAANLHCRCRGSEHSFLGWSSRRWHREDYCSINRRDEIAKSSPRTRLHFLDLGSTSVDLGHTV